MKTYITTYFKTPVKGRNKGKQIKCHYKTKSLTSMHKWIHETADRATTIETDDTVNWPFGLYAEIIAITDKAKPERNKPFQNAQPVTA